MIKHNIKKLFCNSSSIKTNLVSLNDINKEASEIEKKERYELERTGSDLSIPNNLIKTISKSAVFKNANIDYLKDSDFLTKAYKNSSNSKIFLKYLNKLNLIKEYSGIFREFFQSLAKNDENYLDLVAEPRLVDFINKNLNDLRKKGYIIELESLKIENSICEVLDWKIYKNLRIRREDNPTSLNEYKSNMEIYNQNLNSNKNAEISNRGYIEYSKKAVYKKDNQENSDVPAAMKFDKYFRNKLIIGRYINEDKSVFDNNKPIILSSVVKIKTPMKLVIYNQNFSKKIFGKSDEEEMEYIVKFETELSYSQLFSVFSTANKISKTRQSRIVDFNNVLNGNPFDGLEKLNDKL